MVRYAQFRDHLRFGQIQKRILHGEGGIQKPTEQLCGLRKELRVSCVSRERAHSGWAQWKVYSHLTVLRDHHEFLVATPSCCQHSNRQEHERSGSLRFLAIDVGWVWITAFLCAASPQGYAVQASPELTFKICGQILLTQIGRAHV